MATRKYFGETLTATISTNAGSSLDFGIFQEVSVTVEFEHEELYGSGSILRQDVARHTARVKWKCKSASVDAKIMGEMVGTYAEHTGTGSINDTSTATIFDLTGIITDTSGKTFTATVSDAYFDNVPIIPEGTARDAWVMWEFEGTAKDVSF